MGIRDALSDDYLARSFDPGALARARDYLDAVLDLEVVHESGSGLTATALVLGDRTRALPRAVPRPR